MKAYILTEDDFEKLHESITLQAYSIDHRREVPSETIERLHRYFNYVVRQWCNEVQK